MRVHFRKSGENWGSEEFDGIWGKHLPVIDYSKQKEIERCDDIMVLSAVLQHSF